MRFSFPLHVSHPNGFMIVSIPQHNFPFVYESRRLLRVVVMVVTVVVAATSRIGYSSGRRFILLVVMVVIVVVVIITVGGMLTINFFKNIMQFTAG